MIDIFVSITCGALLVSLIMALIFKDQFRGDVLGHEGEAKVLGLITVKGVSIVILSALFLGGMVYPMSNRPLGHTCTKEVQKIGTLVHAKYRYEIEDAANKPDRSTLKKMVQDLQDAVGEAEACINS